MIGAAPRFATPGYLERLGTVERWNKTLKERLSKNIQAHGNDFDIHLPYLLFAYREVPHSTTGLSPYQLVYGRLPRGPLALMRDFWTGKRNIPLGVSRSIEKFWKICDRIWRGPTKLPLETPKRTRQNILAREKTFQVGEKVKILESVSPHK
ncbi:hypothetical protein AVEN_23324-1 [Araneus ventricosus]|uniref:Integrase catalytic domain-containing protein n=1 Tax=Araneus ventricosus TaxID=182803 RepID=A0A4Y2FTB3_ARAVE|nr:hypothetical protein AVEN_23324-1 [Araneus ventricosus]